uniref:Uncharacterized protein n=1 Tax=Cyprinus carpio TaxID=7962 RepID=A0A8C1UZ17_CYPCA
LLLCDGDLHKSLQGLVLCWFKLVLCWFKPILCWFKPILCWFKLVLCWFMPVLCWFKPVLCWFKPVLCWFKPVLCWFKPVLCWFKPVLCWFKPASQRQNIPNQHMLFFSTGLFDSLAGSVNISPAASQMTHYPLCTYTLCRLLTHYVATQQCSI